MRKSTVDEQRKSDIVDRLLKGPIGQQLSEEIAEDRRAERQQLIDEIVATQAALDRDGPGLQKALRDAETELERAENIAAAARAKRLSAVSALSSYSTRADRAILKRQAKLRETADPGIEELILEIERKFNAFRNRTPVEVRAGSEPDAEASGPDQRKRVYVSRAAAINAQMRTLEDLRAECEALKVTHAGNPQERLDDIRRRMPSLDAPLQAEYHTVERPRTVTVSR